MIGLENEWNVGLGQELKEREWDERLQQELKEHKENGLHLAEIRTGNGQSPGVNNIGKHRCTHGKENDEITERVFKGEDFVWKPRLEGLEYLTILILPICCMKQCLDGTIRMSVR